MKLQWDDASPSPRASVYVTAENERIEAAALEDGVPMVKAMPPDRRPLRLHLLQTKRLSLLKRYLKSISNEVSSALFANVSRTLGISMEPMR